MRQWYSLCWCTTLKLGFWNKHRKQITDIWNVLFEENCRSNSQIRNKEVCDRVGLLQDVTNRIQQRRTQYFGHVQRMDHTRYPTLALHGYVHGTRRQGRPKKRWIDMVKDDCKQHDIDIHQAWENTGNSTSFCMEEPGEAAYARICVTTAISQVKSIVEGLGHFVLKFWANIRRDSAGLCKLNTKNWRFPTNIWLYFEKCARYGHSWKTHRNLYVAYYMIYRMVPFEFPMIFNHP